MQTNRKIVYVTGISGTGKTTLAKGFVKNGKVAIDIDEYSRWYNTESGVQVHGIKEFTQEFLDTHKWIADIKELKETFEENKDVDVFVFGVIGMLKNHLDLFNKVILLTCSTETAFKRIDQRDDNDFGKDDSTKEWIKSWKDGFEKDWIALGAIPVNAEDSIEVVMENILNICK